MRGSLCRSPPTASCVATIGQAPGSGTASALCLPHRPPGQPCRPWGHCCTGAGPSGEAFRRLLPTFPMHPLPCAPGYRLGPRKQLQTWFCGSRLTWVPPGRWRWALAPQVTSSGVSRDNQKRIGRSGVLMKRDTWAQGQAGTQTDACEGWGQAASCQGAPEAGRGACCPLEPSEEQGL